MNLEQTKVVGLTMKLDLKTREFKKLCDQIEKLEKDGIDPNDERLIELCDLFQKNHDEIVEIKNELRKLN